MYDTEKQALRSTPQAITKEKAFNSLNSVEPNPTTNALKTQDLSPLEQAKAEKLAKLESERLESEQGIKVVSKKSAEKTENQFTLKQRLTSADIIHSFIPPARTLKE